MAFDNIIGIPNNGTPSGDLQSVNSSSNINIV